MIPSPSEENMSHRNDPEVIRSVLTTSATWAVVGLSENRGRTAHGIAGYLQGDLGMTIVPVHPKAQTVHGATGYASLDDIPDGQTVDVVDFFVNSSHVGSVVDEAIANKDRLNIATLWLQLGVIDEAAAQRAVDAGLVVIMDTCPAIEYPKL